MNNTPDLPELPKSSHHNEALLEAIKRIEEQQRHIHDLYESTVTKRALEAIKVGFPQMPKIAQPAAVKLPIPPLPKIAQPVAVKLPIPPMPKIAQPAAVKLPMPPMPKIAQPAAVKLPMPPLPKIAQPVIGTVTLPQMPSIPQALLDKVGLPKMPSPKLPTVAFLEQVQSFKLPDNKPLFKTPTVPKKRAKLSYVSKSAIDTKEIVKAIKDRSDADRIQEQELKDSMIQQNANLQSLIVKNDLMIDALTKLTDHTVAFETAKASEAQSQNTITTWTFYISIISLLVGGLQLFFSEKQEVNVYPHVIVSRDTPHVPNELGPFFKTFEMAKKYK